MSNGFTTAGSSRGQNRTMRRQIAPAITTTKSAWTATFVASSQRNPSPDHRTAIPTTVVTKAAATEMPPSSFIRW